jgi:hypothetical protein
VQQGEIRRRLDTVGPVPLFVMVLSGPNHLAGDTTRVVVCRVLPGASPEDFSGFHRVSYTFDGVSTIGLAVPELIEWYPRSALSEPVGLATTVPACLRLVNALFE